MNCRMAASCKAGMCFTPSFDAIQVVPQKKDMAPKAQYPFWVDEVAGIMKSKGTIPDKGSLFF